MRNTILAAALGLASVFSCGQAKAAPINFQITAGSFQTGSGYGTNTGQLDVTFTNLMTAQNFNLNLGDTHSFLFGRATLGESCIDPSPLCGFASLLGLNGNETNNLEVTTKFTFVNPFSETVQVVAATGAFTGPVNGGGFFEALFPTDHYIDFAPLVVKFGLGGSFVLDVGDMFFSSTGSITNGANVTLTAVPVPAPAGLALLGLALLGLGLVRRKAA